MNGMYVGRTKKGQKVTIGDGSPNKHVISTGISGSGKSTRINEITQKQAENGQTVLELDSYDTHIPEDTERYNHISVNRDGLKLAFFENEADLYTESRASRVSDMTEVLSSGSGLGPRQKEALRKAVSSALSQADSECSMLKKVADGLKEQNNLAASSVYERLCLSLEGNMFRSNGKCIEAQKNNIVSFDGVGAESRKQAIEITMAAIWQAIRKKRGYPNGLTIVLDEFQNLTFDRRSTLYQMLTEGRKYGINLLLATQSMAVFSKTQIAAINQTAVRLYFRQSISDVRHIADLIDHDRREYWISILKELPIGAAVTIGNLAMGGRLIQKPIVTYSEPVSE